jgi:AcrR family transcriptional regulator
LTRLAAPRILNVFKNMPPPKELSKSEETRNRILEAALALFREQGFDKATMRDIAARAEVATGAAYYYYASKDAIVLDFYERSSAEMLPQTAAAIAEAKGLEDRLRASISTKLDYFAPNRSVLRALLRNGADPQHPLSPFSAETQTIRDADIELFRQLLVDCGMRIPRDLAPYLPRVLWFYQMGVILFWITDDSHGQARTTRLLDLSAKSVATLIRLSALPLMRPVRRTAIDLIRIVEGTAE